MADPEWNEVAQLHQLLYGFSKEGKDELAYGETPVILDPFIFLSLSIDNWLCK